MTGPRVYRLTAIEPRFVSAALVVRERRPTYQAPDGATVLPVTVVLMHIACARAAGADVLAVQRVVADRDACARCGAWLCPTHWN